MRRISAQKCKNAICFFKECSAFWNWTRRRDLIWLLLLLQVFLYSLNTRRIVRIQNHGKMRLIGSQEGEPIQFHIHNYHFILKLTNKTRCGMYVCIQRENTCSDKISSLHTPFIKSFTQNLSIHTQSHFLWDDPLKFTIFP